MEKRLIFFLIVTFFVIHQVFARKCFPITEAESTAQDNTASPTVKTESTTQSTDEGFNNSSQSYNYVELFDNFFQLELKIDDLYEYLIGNLTAINEIIFDISSDITTILADTNLTDGVVAYLREMLEAFQNHSSTSNNKRKKRFLSIFVEEEVVETPCEEASDISEKLQGSIDSGNSNIEAANNNVNTLTLMQSNIDTFNSEHSNMNLDSLNSNMGNLDNQYLNLLNVQSEINKLRTEQKENFDPIAEKICTMNLGPCGTFAPYNPIDNPNELVGKAFSAGKYIDGTESYVGAGKLTDFIEKYYLPGRATISGNLQGPGVYVLLNQSEINVVDGAEYLENHYDLHWVPADKDNLSSIRGAIQIQNEDETIKYLIGRYNLTCVNSTSLGQAGSLNMHSSSVVKTFYNQVAKIKFNSDSDNLWYADENQVSQPADTNFEVLICKPHSNGAFLKDMRNRLIQESSSEIPDDSALVSYGTFSLKFDDTSVQVL